MSGQFSASCPDDGAVLRTGLPMTPRESPPMDDDLFEDIIWPEDDTLEPGVTLNRGSKQESPGAVPARERKLKSESESSTSSVSGHSGREDCSEPRSKARSASGAGAARFSKEARSILRIWFHEHRENPYPTNDEKDSLVTRTGLERGQVSLWLANARRRDRARASQKKNAAAAPPAPQLTFDEMNPFDRWKVTPVEVEGYTPPAIMAGFENNPLRPLQPIDEEPADPVASASLIDEISTTTVSQFDNYWGQSVASFDTGLTSVPCSSSISGETAFSHGSLNPARNRMGSRDRRRRRVNPAKPTNPAAKAKAKPRPFQCTFCPDSTFATKHDWQRHEKSQHLSLEKWVCCNTGGTLSTPTGLICAFCHLPDPSKQHLETHNFSACQLKEPTERTFYRKDHFQQHLHLTHECKINSRMSDWKSEITDVKSRCGFCGAFFNTWPARADHLASHFRSRATMQDWLGDWGFEPHIAKLVERAPLAALLLEPLGGLHAAPDTAAYDTAQMPPPPLPSKATAPMPPLPLPPPYPAGDSALNAQLDAADLFAPPILGYGGGFLPDLVAKGFVATDHAGIGTQFKQ